VDYRERLSPEDFTVFARLRDLRKRMAQAEAVPVYAGFTNDQLARMVQARATSKAALESIAGVGDARIEKYGPRFLDFLKISWGGHCPPIYLWAAEVVAWWAVPTLLLDLPSLMSHQSFSIPDRI
jgi:hypothetical protein